MTELLWLLICTVHLTLCSFHVTYTFQSKLTLYKCMILKELLAQSRRNIWSLSDYNWTRAHKQLCHKRALIHLAKRQTGWTIELSCEHLSARCIWLCILVMLCTRFIVNPHSIVGWMARNFFLETGKEF